MGTLVNDVTTTQNKAIWEHLAQGKAITRQDALSLYGCVNLPGRIWDLKKSYDISPELPAITKKMIPVLNRQKKAVHVAQYSINPAYVAKLQRAVAV